MALLTQLVGGGDNVSGDARVQISVHDAEGVQLGHVVPSDLQGVTTAQSPPKTGETEEEGQGRLEERVKQRRTKQMQQANRREERRDGAGNEEEKEERRKGKE